MGRKKKIEQLNQTNGKIETFEPTTLDQVWGDTGLNKYQTLDVEKYKASLTDMNKTDLYRHATTIGIMPTDNREQLEKKLISEFQAYTNQFKRPVTKPSPAPNVSEEVRKILAEGR